MSWFQSYTHLALASFLCQVAIFTVFVTAPLRKDPDAREEASHGAVVVSIFSSLLLVGLWYAAHPSLLRLFPGFLLVDGIYFGVSLAYGSILNGVRREVNFPFYYDLSGVTLILTVFFSLNEVAVLAAYRGIRWLIP